MKAHAFRLIVRAKLTDGRLPSNSIPRGWGGPGNGEPCDACEEIITKDQLLIEGVPLKGGRRLVQFHVACFHVWDSEGHAAKIDSA